MFGQTLEGCLAVNIMSVKISTMRQDERWLAGYKEVMRVQEENLGDAHDAALSWHRGASQPAGYRLVP